jgi:hypothetical protein
MGATVCESSRVPGKWGIEKEPCGMRIGTHGVIVVALTLSAPLGFGVAANAILR